MNAFRVPTSAGYRSHVRADWSPPVLIIVGPGDPLPPRAAVSGYPGAVAAVSLRAFEDRRWRPRRRRLTARELPPGVYLDGLNIERFECCLRERADGHAPDCPTPFTIT